MNKLPALAYKCILYIKGFTIVPVDISDSTRKCIQFTDKGGTTYALKVISGTNLTRFEVSNSNLNLNVFEVCSIFTIHFC